MSSYLVLLFLFLTLLISELRPLCLSISIVLIFVFLLVSQASVPFRSSFLSSLVFCLFVIVFWFITTSSLLIFFVLYELSLFPVLLLVVLFGYQPEKLNSGLFLLLYTVVCSSPIIFISLTVSGMLSSRLSSLSPFASFLVCLSFIVKAPVYTIHSWLPKAHVEAPLVGSILLSGVILKLGSYGLILLSPSLGVYSSIFIYLTLSGGVVCSSICCRAWDMKSLVAYSSVVHIGVVRLGVFSGLELGLCVACGILVGHSLVSPLLFSLAYELYLSSSSRGFIYGHMSSVSSGLILAIRVLSGINFGLPPFLSFWVEVSLFGVLGSVWGLSLLPLLLTAFLSFLYSLLFYVLSCGGPVSSSLPFGRSLLFYLPSCFFMLALPARSLCLFC